MSDHWEIRAFRYADRPGRTRAESFIADDDHASPHDMDYFVWLLTSGARQIVVDTGYDAAEGERRGRPILRDPAEALGLWGVDTGAVEEVIITHLHYDHAGSFGRFPTARFHMQAAEMAYATGPDMCHAALRQPYTLDHVVAALTHVYSGRVVFHDGDAEIAPGVTVHRIGGHSRGLQAVRVATRTGPVVLASDGSHYWENMLSEKLFPILADAGEMLRGFRTLRSLADRPERVIPGHDPLVRRLYPAEARGEDVYRLDTAPLGRLDSSGRLA